MIDPAAFDRRPLLADGDMGSALRARHPDWRAPIEALNEARPADVQALHEAFAAAGAQLLRGNTERACAAALEPHGLAERAEAINNSGSNLARAARGSGAGSGAGSGTASAAGPRLVMGTLGPPPHVEALDDPRWQRAYAEQAIYLADTGVDFILLQHFTHLAHVLALTRHLKGATDAPLLAALRFDATGRTAEGTSAHDAAASLVDAGADALGLSCGPGPAALPACLAALQRQGLPVAVLAGIRTRGETAPYADAPALDPAAFAAWLAPLAPGGAGGEPGVAILGGCCGVGPAHIRALAQRLGRRAAE